jgi:hypothetical protein
MKINEISTPSTVNEGIGSALIGDRAASAIRGFVSGEGTKQTMYQKAFLKDFYQDAIVSLKNGIEGGFIDLGVASNLNSGNAGAQDPKPQDTTKSDTELAPGAPASTAPAPTAIPPKPKQSGPTGAEQTVAAAQKHRQDVASASNRMAAGKAAQAKPAFQRTADDKLAMKAAGLSEARFSRLNYIFERIVGEQEEPASSGVGIGQYMLDWFNAYMQNTKWESYKAQVLPQIQQIEDFYNNKGQRKTAIMQLAKTALAISKLSPIPPKGAENVIQGADAQKADPVKDALKRIVSGGGATDPEQLATKISDLSPESQKQIAAQIDAFKAAGK